jgi:hypothetical protein
MRMRENSEEVEEVMHTEPIAYRDQHTPLTGFFAWVTRKVDNVQAFSSSMEVLGSMTTPNDAHRISRISASWLRFRHVCRRRCWRSTTHHGLRHGIAR